MSLNHRNIMTNEEQELTEEIEFPGVFIFSNPTDDDFVFFWNNNEYLYPANKTVPMLIKNETLENIQEIRKKAAFKLAYRWFYNSATYKKMSKMGNGLPPTFDEKQLEPMIEKCLKPLPMARASIKEGRKIISDKSFKGSKAISDKENPNFVFKDEEVIEKGKMPNKEI